MTQLDKPITRRARLRVPHGVKPDVCVTLYPDGQIGLREAGRRDEYLLDLGTLYVNVMLNTSRKIVRRAKEIKKAQGISLPEARKKAKREVLKNS